MKNIVINTERLILKSPVGIVTPEDILKAINYKETLQYLSSAPKYYSIESAKSFLDFLTKYEGSDRMLELGAFDKLSGLFIGMITLENINYDDLSCELGFWVSKPFTGKGLAFEGSKKLIEFAFNTMKLQRVDAFVIKEHLKSISLVERLGFRKMELLIDNERNNGILVDRYKYSLLNTDGEKVCNT